MDAQNQTLEESEHHTIRITVEGGPKTGKSTLIALITDTLATRGVMMVADAEFPPDVVPDEQARQAIRTLRHRIKVTMAEKQVGLFGPLPDFYRAMNGLSPAELETALAVMLRVHEGETQTRAIERVAEMKGTLMLFEGKVSDKAGAVVKRGTE